MRIHTIVLPLLAATLLAACNPKYNWRDYSSQDAPFRAMFPDKPATHTREVNLGELKVNMTMTASKIGDTTFAIGSAEAPDDDSAAAAVPAMKNAMLRNIRATIEKEAMAKASSAAGATTARSTAINVTAKGLKDGQPIRLVAHFEARNKRIYQVIVIGPEKDVPEEQVEQFMTSFKLQ
jgi:hypothetical protein